VTLVPNESTRVPRYESHESSDKKYSRSEPSIATRVRASLPGRQQQPRARASMGDTPAHSGRSSEPAREHRPPADPLGICRGYVRTRDAPRPCVSSLGSNPWSVGLSSVRASATGRCVRELPIGCRALLFGAIGRGERCRRSCLEHSCLMSVAAVSGVGWCRDRINRRVGVISAQMSSVALIAACQRVAVSDDVLCAVRCPLLAVVWRTGRVPSARVLARRVSSEEICWSSRGQVLLVYSEPLVWRSLRGRDGLGM
jgi:hypothetical protein